jgi:hypothetical protein
MASFAWDNNKTFTNDQANQANADLKDIYSGVTIEANKGLVPVIFVLGILALLIYNKKKRG